LTTFEQKIGYAFANPALLEQAFTHKSYQNERQLDLTSTHNERLEFLGDAVLDLALSDYLMRVFPEANEGELSKIRASLVNESILAEVAKAYDMSQRLRLGKGEILTKGAEKPRLLASCFEAVMGALYLDAGFDRVNAFVEDVFKDFVANLDPKNGYVSDFKTRLQEVTQEKFKKTPVYCILGETGPDHDKIFKVEVQVQKDLVFEGEGKSKKQAEQAAAEKAIKELMK
jgi:ribonuclease-3